jgi:predicted alpha/beta-fold hydrolase
MIFCNPNACYYEYLPYQTEWVDFYYSLGVNLVIWNYRCYNRSQSSSISPSGIMKDGEKVYQYLKSNMVTGKIGIHGESLGGCVASYVAKKNLVDFVFSDRTFSSLADMAQYSFGGKLTKFLFRVLTRWSEECDTNYSDI